LTDADVVASFPLSAEGINSYTARCGFQGAIDGLR
jgi:uncharacterized ferredoxin-like protein